MFRTGQKVVCVDDQFEDWALAMYDNLPTKGSIYTIRTSNFGRTDPKCQGLDSMEEKVTLEELTNPIDPHYKGGRQELGFRGTRFVPLDEIADNEELEEACRIAQPALA